MFMGIPLASSFIDSIFKSWINPLEIPGQRQVKRLGRAIGTMGKGLDGLDQGEKQDIFWALADTASDFSRVPVSKIAEKALKGEDFREKLFGPVKKKPTRGRRGQRR
jgi:hypothetical protein